MATPTNQCRGYREKVCDNGINVCKGLVGLSHGYDECGAGVGRGHPKKTLCPFAVLFSCHTGLAYLCLCDVRIA